MAIGTSTGAYFDDAFHQASSSYVEDPMSTPDNNEVSPDDVKDKKAYSTGKPIQASERLYVSPNDISPIGSGMPGGSPTEAAGALKPSGGTPAPDYDYDAWRASNPGVEMAPGQHYPDTYKLPNHMTFSDESIYHGQNGAQGGHWGTDEEGKDTFTPGRTNLEQHSMGELRDYFSRVEPNAKLLPPDINDVPHHDWVEGLIKGVVEHAKNAFGLMDAPEWAVDPETGEVHTSSQSIEKANDLAGLMTFGPAPVASKMADGTLGSFMGVHSATFDREALQNAQKAELTGVHPDDIWNSTRTARGADGRWRQEIPDDKAELNVSKLYNLSGEVGLSKTGSKYPNPSDYPQSLEGVEKWKNDMDAYRNPSVKLKDILDHPELYKAYPHLADHPVRPMPAGSSSMGMASHEALYIGQATPEDFRHTLLHEVQHYIQNHEGFARGGAWTQFAPKEFHQMFSDLKAKINKVNQGLKDRGLTNQEINNLHTAAAQDIRGELNPETKQIIQNHPAKADYDKIKVYNKAIIEANGLYYKYYDQYHKLMGEVEARNVEARSRMNDQLRQLNSPETTEKLDTPRSQQINSNKSGTPASDKPITFRRGANDNLPENHPDRPYNDREPSMIGSREADKQYEESFKRFQQSQEVSEEIRKLNMKYPHNDIDRARLKKLTKQRDDLFKL